MENLRKALEKKRAANRCSPDLKLVETYFGREKGTSLFFRSVSLHSAKEKHNNSGIKGANGERSIGEFRGDHCNIYKLLYPDPGCWSARQIQIRGALEMSNIMLASPPPPPITSLFLVQSSKIWCIYRIWQVLSKITKKVCKNDVKSGSCILWNFGFFIFGPIWFKF